MGSHPVSRAPDSFLQTHLLPDERIFLLNINVILCLCCSKLPMAPHCLKDKIQTPTMVFKTLHQLTLPVLPPQHAFTHLASQGHQELTVPTPRSLSAGPAPPSPISTYRGPFECFDGVWQLCPCLPLPQNCNLLKDKDHSRDLLFF